MRLFRMKMWYKLWGVLLAILVMAAGDISAQTDNTKPPLNHSMQTFTDDDNQVFVNQHQGYQFLFSGLKTEDRQVLQNGGETMVALPEGTTTIQVSAADGSTISYPITVDGSSPNSSISLENAPVYRSDSGVTYAGKNLKLKYNSSDNLSGVQDKYWAINNGSYNPFTNENLSFSNNASYLIYYYAVDRVGNVEGIQNIEFVVDVMGPEVNYVVEGPQNLSVTSSESGISLNAIDEGAGVNQIYYWFDEGNASAYSTRIGLNNLDDGEHTLYAYATDNVENSGDTLAYTFYLDRDTPTVTAEINGEVFEQQSTTYISPQSTVSLRPQDNKSGVSATRYQVNQQPEENYTNPIRLPSNSGTYSITYYATDVVGNRGDRQSLKVYLDNGRPVTNVRFQGYYSTTPSGYAIGSDTRIELSASDLESGIKEVRYRLDNGDWRTYDEPLSFEETDPLLLTFYAEDQVGNRETEQQIEIVIREQEQLSMNAEPERVVTGNSRFMKVDEAIQGPNKPVYLWVSSTSADTSQKFMISYAEDSSQVFPLSMESDKETVVSVGVEGEATNYPVTVDGTAPQSTLKATGATSYQNGETLIFAPGVSLSITAEDNITGVKEIYASENGGRYQLYDKPLSGYFSEQKYAIRYYAVDKVGNEENENLYEFNVDATPPITTHRFLNNYSGSNLSLYTTIQLEAVDNMSGVDTTFIQLNENKPVRYTGDLQLSELGTYENTFNTIYYYSVDKVGNEEQEKQFNFKIDTSGPVVEVGWQGDYYQASERVFIHPSTKMGLTASDEEMEIRNIWFTKTGEDERTTYQNPITFSGENQTRINFAAIDVLGNQGKVYQKNIIVDASAPATSYSISGQTLDNGEIVILGKDAQIDFSATDNKSGVAQIRYGINSENLVRYDNPIQFRSSGNKVIRFQAMDRVGNVEELNTLTVVYDRAAPIIDVSYSKQPQSQENYTVQVDAETLISITSVDSESEVQSLEYKWNEENFSTYFRPIKNAETGTHSLTIRTTDVLGNERSQTWQIEIVE